MKMSCRHIPRYKGQNFSGALCHVTVSRLVWSDCSGVGRRVLCSGDMSREQNVCLVGALSRHYSGWLYKEDIDINM
jgi:hypothetical protein